MQPQFTYTKPHSKLGIASLVIGAGTFTTAVTWYLMLDRLAPADAGRFGQNFSSMFMLYIFIGAPIAHLAGEILGLVSLFFTQRKKLFPVLGVLINIPFLVFWLIFYAILLELWRQMHR